MNIIRIMRLPDVFTLLNVVFGFLAILAAGGAWGRGNVHYALVFILLAAIADGVDGFLARKVGGSVLGADLDSLADMLSFGAAPAYFAISAFHIPPLLWPAGIFFLLCGILRLARFNVVSARGDQFFEGLPIPAAGIALSASVLLGRPAMTVALMLLLALLMASSISYPKIRELWVMAMLGAIFLGVGVYLYIEENIIRAALVIIALIAAYLASPVVVSRIRKKR
ncbi:MAG TPA: CDP-diacylglycerol--serine O-phosphatidyltransferase [Methanothrix sp.]|nr:CDP-diacylglycerol--serine O-phosphatidyltransferase [Methanothrix sp.]HOV81075.1 CDP-diacylglycerol--serine O-phosphatidyltransferase [Methanothrix sp.]HPC88899.1 CDP-diacylglycerol--serine O-phosphatidyltransferase [Methanothrix sp.]HQE86676.1 CDP-diacylglycerol--serine O-phosphatidyltransferase [Methanothrix sp.]HQI67206.1 CDP-diacylglycerol--serine O-phosphatidyltransferase [Methanothrix sp.]